MQFQNSDSLLGEFRDSASVVPIRNEDVRIGIDEAAVRCAEHARSDLIRIEFIIRPLRFLRIVTQESNWHVIAIENGNAPFQFRHDRVISIETELAWPPQVLGHGANVFAVQVEVAQTAVFAIAHQQQRLVITEIHAKAVTAVELPFAVPFLGKGSLVIAVLVEMENA